MLGIHKKCVRIAAAILTPITLLLSQTVLADVLMLSRIDDSVEGRSAAYTWASADAFKFDDGKRALIADFTTNRMMLLDHRAKTVQLLPLQRARGALPQQSAVPLGASGRVGQWTTQRYALAWPQYGMSSTVDVTAPNAETAPLRLALNRLRGVPGATWLSSLAELPGVPVKIETTLTTDNGTRTNTRQALNILERDPPAGTYQRPAGYKQVLGE